MEKNTLEDFIAKLSPEERLRHQALIEECLERKRLIDKNSEKAYKSVEDLNNSLKDLRQGMTRLEKSSELQREAIFNLMSDIVPLLKSLPGGRPSMN